MHNKYYEKFNINDAEPYALDLVCFGNILISIPQYVKSHTYELQRIQLENTKVLCKSVNVYRVNKSAKILDQYHRLGVQAFYPLELRYQEVSQVIFPPVVHYDPSLGIKLVVDGMHRLYAARKISLNLIVLTIEGPIGQLPGDPISWEQVDLIDYEVPITEKFVNFRHEGFRNPYTVTFNSEDLWYEGGLDCLGRREAVRVKLNL